MPGAISADGQLDEWRFFALAGQSVTALVDPGSGGTYSPLAPRLDWARAQLLDSTGAVLATGSNSASGGVVVFSNIVLPADGAYRIRVSAPSGHSGATGNYQVGVWNVTPNVQSLSANQRVTGSIATPFAIDEWKFSAAAAEQVRFNLINTSAPGLNFTLTAADGTAVFSSLTASSSLLTLPIAGTYTLSVFGTDGATAAYAFRIDQTTVIAQALGDSYSGELAGPNEAVIFNVNVSESKSVLATLSDGTAADVNELYAKFGAPPTRDDYDYRYSALSAASQSVLVPKAAIGHWYFLVYTASVPSPSAFTFSTNSADVRLTGIVPDHAGNSAPATLTISGAGFVAGTTVELLAADGTTYAASQVSIDSFTQITAAVPLSNVPAGAYSVEVQRPGADQAILNAAFTVKQGGAPNLVTHIIIPNPIGYHIASTIYVQYTNTGDVAMPAPLLVVNATMNGVAGALMTLDASKVVSGYWTSATPAGYSQSVQFLASGATPGVLQPGESEQMPVYYAGWLNNLWDFSRPPITFTVSVLGSDNATAIDWPSLENGLQPARIASDAWHAMFPALTAQMGPTWGAYVSELDADASYLGRLGENVTDISTLWRFELAKADGLSPVPQLAGGTDISVVAPGLSLDFTRVYNESITSRYTQGMLGYGWATPWETSLNVTSDGTVTVNTGVGGFRSFQPDSRHSGGYFSQTADNGILTLDPGGDYLLREVNGYLTAYRPDGKLDYVQDTNGNRITAGYTAARLTSLTHSSGQSLTLSYNTAGLLASVTSSDGRQVLYFYDSNNQLTSIKGVDGQTTGYDYLNGAVRDGTRSGQH